MGLRGRLTLFTGFFLLLIVSVVIAVSRKQQERVFSDSVLRETSPYFLPAKRMVVDSAHLEKNLVSIERAVLKNAINNATYGSKAVAKSRLVFPDEYFKRASDLQQNAYEQNAEGAKGKFDAWKITAVLAA